MQTRLPKGASVRASQCTDRALMASQPDSNRNGNGLNEEKEDTVTESPDSMSDVDDDHYSSGVGPVKSVTHPDGNGHDITGLHHHDAHTSDDDAGTDEEGEDSDDDGTDEEEDEDDEEPALKYERLGGIIHQLLQKDSASAIAYANQQIVSIGFCWYGVWSDRVHRSWVPMAACYTSSPLLASSSSPSNPTRLQ